MENSIEYRIQFLNLETKPALRTPGLTPPTPGSWLVFYDPDFANGRGEVVWSIDKRKAKVFLSLQDAMEYYYQTSLLKPIRETDGKPNRPLTSCTVHFVREVADG